MGNSKGFDKIADLLVVLGENPYKASAYRRTAHKLGNIYLDVEQLAIEGYLQEIPGVGFCINTDAHDIHYMGDIRYGVLQARRGWAERKDIINTMS